VVRKEAAEDLWAKWCLRWRGRVLDGLHAHACPEWDDLPLDESCPEWPCYCGFDGGKTAMVIDVMMDHERELLLQLLNDAISRRGVDPYRHSTAAQCHTLIRRIEAADEIVIRSLEKVPG
jgi:hypothetical protein